MCSMILLQPHADQSLTIIELILKEAIAAKGQRTNCSLQRAVSYVSSASVYLRPGALIHNITRSEQGRLLSKCSLNI